MSTRRGLGLAVLASALALGATACHGSGVNKAGGSSQGRSKPLVLPPDYRGATIAIRLGGVARATFATLGATAKGYVIGVLPAVDGAELDLNTIAENGYDARSRALTANVVLWPRPQTIFANRAA